uniref:BTB domain-containing protein n=1 Tax=Angiostrongylus cantonensis TaxID=6313 RepID=A0A0K0DRT8_ANGCA
MTFSTPNHHPRSQPFFDHVFSFSVTPDLKIWIRNFQIVDETLQLQEIGPRFVLETIRIFAGSFSGAVLYDNPDYESPNTKRRTLKLANRGKYIEKQLKKKVADSKDVQIKEVMAVKMEDPVGEVFEIKEESLTEEAQKIAAIIHKKKRKKKKIFKRPNISWLKNTDASAEQYVKLNVGGALFQTTVGTLTKHDTMLRAMFSGRMEVVTDSNGWVLIDRSGRHFGVILDFLRDGFVPLPECRVEVEQILVEARYYLVQVSIPQKPL